MLLLEAGPDYRSADMPEVWRSPNPIQALRHPEVAGELVWPDLLATRTEVQEAQLYWRGRGAGGSSAINGQIAIRPPREDYDDWAAAGCDGWSFDDVLPYLCRIETDLAFGEAPYHGSSGPIPVYRAPRASWGSVDEALARAALTEGFPWAEDLNAPGATGVSPYPINSRDFRRVSTNDAYLEPLRELENLSVLGDALVDRVIFDGRRAVGVEVIRDGARGSEYGEEIVLCAGVIHSPAILMRSGIGPAAALSGLDIDVFADLPVGEGMQDHPILAIGLPLRADTAIRTPDDRHTNCCVRYSSGDPDGAPNDMMMVAMNQSVLAMGRADTGSGAGSVGVWVNRAYSCGSLTLTSRDPHAQPLVREGMLADERDRRRLRDAVRMLAGLATGQAITGICAVSPEDANPELWKAIDDDDQLDAHLLAVAADTQHGTSTCRMGAIGDPATVVDPQCRVLGVDGLRVADASIFPFVPRSNTNLATIAIGEVLADRLDW